MSKIIGIGDLHGRPYWKQIWEKHSDADKIVFVGDYFDSLDGYTELPVYSAAEQIYNFREICALKREFPDKIEILLGNHDIHYFRGLKGQTAGFQTEHAVFIQMALEENKDILKMAWLGNNKFLFSHVGISGAWLDDIYGKGGWDVNHLADAVNDVWTWKPKAFMFNEYCMNKYGDDPQQSPVWIRQKSLMRGAKDYKKRYVQVFGHTCQDNIDLKGKSTGCRYYCIDTLPTSGEYIIINGDTITTQKINNEDLRAFRKLHGKRDKPSRKAKSRGPG